MAGHLERMGWVPLRANPEEEEGNGGARRQPPRACAPQAAERLCLVEFGAGTAQLTKLVSGRASSCASLRFCFD